MKSLLLVVVGMFLLELEVIRIVGWGWIIENECSWEKEDLVNWVLDNTTIQSASEIPNWSPEVLKKLRALHVARDASCSLDDVKYAFIQLMVLDDRLNYFGDLSRCVFKIENAFLH